MNGAPWNLKLIRVPIVLFILALGVSGAMVWIAQDFWAGIDTVFERTQRGLRASQTRYRTVDDEKEVIAEYLPRFEMLREAGIVGDERRLQWVETLRRVARDLRLPALRYTLSSREPLQPDFKMPPGTYQAHASDMNLEVGLLHEADLLRLVNALDREVEGLFDVRQCRLELTAPFVTTASAGAPITEEDEVNVDATAISANCVLRWLTLTTPERDGDV